MARQWPNAFAWYVDHYSIQADAMRMGDFSITRNIGAHARPLIICRHSRRPFQNRQSVVISFSLWAVEKTFASRRVYVIRAITEGHLRVSPYMVPRVMCALCADWLAISEADSLAARCAGQHVSVLHNIDF